MPVDKKQREHLEALDVEIQTVANDRGYLGVVRDRRTKQAVRSFQAATEPDALQMALDSVVTMEKPKSPSELAAENAKLRDELDKLKSKK
jgi:hypothetical protein